MCVYVCVTWVCGWWVVGGVKGLRVQSLGVSGEAPSFLHVTGVSEGQEGERDSSVTEVISNYVDK